jgi:hypothetical protein
LAETAASLVLRGRYHVGDELSRTGAVVTRRGHDELLQRDVSVTMPPEPTSAGTVPGDAARDRVEAAREVLADLDHPALPRVFDGGTDGDLPYLVTELFGGESLARRRRRGPLDRSSAAAVGAVLADLLACLHSRDLVHGPLSPEAVWIEDDGRIRVGGLGITPAPDDPQDRRAATADDVASLGRLLRAATAQDATDAGEWDALLDRMTAAALADRPAPGDIRARLRVLAAHPAPADTRTEARTDEPATPHDPVPTVPATAALTRPWRTRAPVAVLTTAAAAIVGIGALLVAPTLSAPGGEGDRSPGRAPAGVQPTPTRPPATSPAPVALEPPTAGEAARGEAPEGKGKSEDEKDKGKAEKDKNKEKGKGKSGNG